MTDRAILDHVYRELRAGRVHQEMIDFIEKEWQKECKKESDLEMKMLSENPSKKWYTDVRDMERHRGLEIGPDGTVTGIKDSPPPKWVKEDWSKSYEPTDGEIK